MQVSSPHIRRNGEAEASSFGFHVQWIKDDEINTGAAISGEAEITINSGKLTTAYDLNITAAKDLIIKHPLERKLSHEIAFEENGIFCDTDHWGAICATAKKVLVPDSERSHSSAGAEVMTVTEFKLLSVQINH